MTASRKPTGTGPRGAWRAWVFWIFAAVALLSMVLEHRAHVLGWWLHALLGLCIVLLYLVLRDDSGGNGHR